MKKVFSLICLSLLLVQPSLAVTLPQGTSVIITNENTIDADNVKQGDTVEFRVRRNITRDEKILVPMGAEVTGKVIKRKNNGILGLPGSLTLGEFYLTIPNKEPLALTGSIVDEGTGRYWANVGWFFLFPLLFVKGDDGKIRANSTYTLYTLEDVEF